MVDSLGTKKVQILFHFKKGKKSIRRIKFDIQYMKSELLC